MALCVSSDMTVTCAPVSIRRFVGIPSNSSVTVQEEGGVQFSTPPRNEPWLTSSGSCK